MKIKLLSLLTSSLLLAACGGGDDSGDSPPAATPSFEVNFQTFNYLYESTYPIAEIEVEAQYTAAPFEQQQTLLNSPIYGTKENTSLLIQYEGDELPAYKVEVALNDQNSQSLLAQQDTTVNSENNDKLVFVVGDKDADTDPARLIILDRPEIDVADNQVGLVVMNLRDTTGSANSYDLTVNDSLFQSGVTQDKLSNVISVLSSSANVKLAVSGPSGVYSCEFDPITVDNWADQDWLVVLDIVDNKEQCNIVRLD